jgi:integrase
MLNWAVGREYITSTPFKRGSETLIKKFQEDNVRRRRMDEQEEAALLAQAPMHIQALIVAAIDTGMRSGEMLALRFADVDLERGLITLRGETTKSRKTRLVPIATTRLRDVFAWLRRDVEGNPKPLETRVFSNELGEPYRLFHRVWQSIVLKAHGHTPTWNPRLIYQGLSDQSQETFRRINLRWHDLRHEYASRLVEHGVPLAQVRDLLGHASITTTERYDNQTLANLQVAAAKLERGLAFRAVSADEVGRGTEATAGSESRPYQTEAESTAARRAGPTPPSPERCRACRDAQSFKILSRSALLQSDLIVRIDHSKQVLSA